MSDDLAKLPKNIARRILDAIEGRLATNPHVYGERLRKSLRGFWKIRVGNYRVVYEIVGQQVRVYGVIHRREVYRRVVRRLISGWRGG